ncbi:MAG: hypothetical protein ACRC9Q_06965 [Bacteroidales bacterium]
MKKLRTTILAGMLLVSVGVFADAHFMVTSCGKVVQVVDTEYLDNPDKLAYIYDELDRTYCGGN